MAQKQLFIFSTAPYTDKQGLETLDAVLLSASFENEVSVLFIEDGVFQLLENQRPQSSGIKPYTKTFKALSDFEVDSVLVERNSLLARGLDVEDLTVDVSLLDASQLADFIESQDRVFHF
jgi:tRNA 2-thiouridine synthesizing protein C